MNDDSIWDPQKKRRMPNIEDIVNAQKLLRGTVRKTPLQTSRTFSGLAGTNLFLKLECLQVTGSFKVRGAFVKISRLSDKQAGHGVIAASAGNHAQGVAYAAMIKKIPCTIVMPETASPAKVAATRSYGAKVIRRGANYDDAWEATQEIAKAESSTIVHAFDDPDVIAGKQPGELTRRIANKYLDDIVLIDDTSIVKTMFLMMERAKLVIEPAGAASLAYLLSNGTLAGNAKDNVATILSGGNVDMYLLGQVVAKGLMQMGRLLKIFLLLPDKPGALKGVVDGIAELSVNIVEVDHDRLSAHIPAGTAGVYLSLELENEKHAQRLINFLKQKGIEFKIVS